MTLKGLKRRIALGLVNRLFASTNPSTFNIKRKLLNWCGIEVGRNSKIVGPLRVYGNLKIGENCWIGTNFTVHGNGNVKIEDNCDIAPDVTVITGSHEIGDKNRRAGIGKNSDVVIKKGTWICAKTTILGGSIIGESCIVGASSLVNKSIENNILLAGVPAKVVKQLD